MSGFADEYDSYGMEDQMYYNDERRDMYSSTGDSLNIKIEDTIKKYITFFRDAIRDGNMYEIPSLHMGFCQLTEEFYKTRTWPTEEELTANKLVDKQDELFLILYKELFYRHIYSLGSPSIKERIQSYYNYCNLFNYILNASSPVPLELPQTWLWDIIDEFIFQFQSFSRYRQRSEEERDMLRECASVWGVHSVLNVLHSLVDKSNINRQLEIYASGGDTDSVAGDFGRHPLYKMLGYFSLVGLLRLHSLLGDYYQALKVLENIELNKKSMYSRVPACQITTYYYVGFAYMMMRRYADAIRTFSNILVYIQRTQSMFQNQNYQKENISKLTDNMYHLLAICLVLHPQRIDEAIQSQLREKPLSEKMAKMSRGDLTEFQQCFKIACPKFLFPIPPTYDSAPLNFFEPQQQQLKVFMDEVVQQSLIGTMRSYLKLYTTMPMEKMAAFQDLDEVDSLRCSLLCFKHKMRNVVWTKGTSSLQGDFQNNSEVDFYIDKNMIHIADTKVAQRYGDFFIRQIHKLEEINRGLCKVKYN